MRCVYQLVPLCILCHYACMYRLSDASTPVLLVAPLGIFALSLGLYLRIIGSSPGHPPVMDEETFGSHDGCRLCNRVKWPRSKHCTICGHCVDTFDHHCDVLDVCIGRNNLALFRSFLCVHMLICLFAAWQHWRFFHNVWPRRDEPVACMVLASLMCTELSFAVTLGMFYVFHCTLCLCDMRTYDLILAWRSMFSSPRRRGEEKRD